MGRSGGCNQQGRDQRDVVKAEPKPPETTADADQCGSERQIATGFPDRSDQRDVAKVRGCEEKAERALSKDHVTPKFETLLVKI